MNIAFKEVVSAWCFALITLVALTGAGWLYLNVGKESALGAVVVIYAVGAFLTYRGKDKPECHGVCRKKLALCSMLWFLILVPFVIITSVFYLAYYNSSTETIGSLQDIL